MASPRPQGLHEALWPLLDLELELGNRVVGVERPPDGALYKLVVRFRDTLHFAEIAARLAPQWPLAPAEQMQPEWLEGYTHSFDEHVLFGPARALPTEAELLAALDPLLKPVAAAEQARGNTLAAAVRRGQREGAIRLRFHRALDAGQTAGRGVEPLLTFDLHGEQAEGLRATGSGDEVVGPLIWRAMPLAVWVAIGQDTDRDTEPPTVP